MDHYEQLEQEIEELQGRVDSLCPIDQEGPREDALHALDALKEKEGVLLSEFWGTVHTLLAEKEEVKS